MRGDFPVLFDTNVYIGILLASDSNKKYLRQVLISTFPEFRCAVVFHELIRGAAYGREARISSYQHSDLKFNNFLVESPNWQDWRNAAYSISEVFRREAHTTKFTCCARCGAVAPRVLGPTRQDALRPPAKWELALAGSGRRFGHIW
jgi:predicted nucleic acid-binding protein